jgi:hypothetical protein
MVPLLVWALSASVQPQLRLKQELRLATGTGTVEKNLVSDYMGILTIKGSLILTVFPNKPVNTTSPPLTFVELSTTTQANR